ncbi:hypothetical protein L596_020993 [Steinernema carpocapsae]|uniref:Uncharacterized protein n=1 Tax=Steinernema carpocapsae TaxID=34508 RepID=A0A4V6A132_STECR|nr:hypothetical protein L596_020993 [Steinernema carpocapsae]
MEVFNNVARHRKGRPDRPVRACPVPASSRLRNHHQQVAGTDATPRWIVLPRTSSLVARAALHGLLARPQHGVNQGPQHRLNPPRAHPQRCLP